jgi:hypothetical protein
MLGETLNIKKIPGFDNYYCSTNGKIFREVRQQPNGNGYNFLFLYVKGKRFKKFIHRLVFETFKSQIPNDKEINHKDYNKVNNNLENLEIVSKSQNCLHRGNIKRGDKPF